MTKTKEIYNATLLRWHKAEIYETKIQGTPNMVKEIEKHAPLLTEISKTLSGLLAIIGTYTETEALYGFTE